MSEGNGKISRDDLRSGLLNGYVRRSKLFTTAEGITIEILQPTVGQRNRMLKAGGLSGASGEIEDIGGMQISAIIECCVEPGTRKQLFDHADAEVLAGLPTGSWFDEVASACMALMNEGAEAGKSSSETKNVSTSSSSPESSVEQSPS
jgi:hypothetical protein